MKFMNVDYETKKKQVIQEIQHWEDTIKIAEKEIEGIQIRIERVKGWMADNEKELVLLEEMKVEAERLTSTKN